MLKEQLADAGHRLLSLNYPVIYLKLNGQLIELVLLSDEIARKICPVEVLMRHCWCFGPSLNLAFACSERRHRRGHDITE